MTAFPRPALLALVLAACASPASAQFDLGGIAGDLLSGAQKVQKIGQSLRQIDEAEEIKLGGDLAAILLGASPLVDDPALQGHVNRLGRWLALHSERPDLPWRFGVIESEDFNAFSTPGGYVIVSRGLVEQMRNEAELAGVLAHEIAHVVRRHHVAALQQSLQNEALGDFDAYFGGTSSLGGGAFGDVLLDAGKTMFTSGLDQDDEYEADRMAVVIAARAGYSPYGLGGVLQTLSGVSGEGYGLMTRTHPSPVDRIERLDRAMGSRLDGFPGSEGDPRFELIQAALLGPEDSEAASPAGE